MTVSYQRAELGYSTELFGEFLENEELGRAVRSEAFTKCWDAMAEAGAIDDPTLTGSWHCLPQPAHLVTYTDENGVEQSYQKNYSERWTLLYPCLRPV